MSISPIPRVKFKRLRRLRLIANYKIVAVTGLEACNDSHLLAVLHRGVGPGRVGWLGLAHCHHLLVTLLGELDLGADCLHLTHRSMVTSIIMCY